MSKHTPEPWSIEEGTGDFDHTHDILAGGEIVCQVVYTTDDRADANARLIAAGTDLLEALKLLYNRLDSAEQKYGSAALKAAAAIAKVETGEPEPREVRR